MLSIVGFASESDFEIMVELEAVRRVAELPIPIGQVQRPWSRSQTARLTASGT